MDRNDQAERNKSSNLPQNALIDPADPSAPVQSSVPNDLAFDGINQLTQLNQVTEVTQLNQLTQATQLNQVTLLNQVTHPNQVTQIAQLDEI